MKVSIFKDWTFLIWIDYSYTPPVEYSPEVRDEETDDIISEEILAVPAIWNPDCVQCIDVQFDPNTQFLEIEKKKSKYIVNVIDKEIIESPEEKKKRILSILISSDEYSSVDTEWISIEHADIWPAIIARFFKGDPNAEMAFLQKWNFLTSIQGKTPEQEAEIEMIKAGYIAKEEFKDFLLTLINK